MLKIMNIVGARPQFVKYSSILKAIERYNASSGKSVNDILLHTGQHYDYSMSRVFFDDFNLKVPDYHLEVGSGTHGLQTGKIIQRAEEVLLKEMPDVVMVYGDTNSTLGCALAAVKLHIPVAHVEAGLRSYNKCMPEEINRVLTDHSSSILFCPSEVAVENLKREGFKSVVNEGSLISSDFNFSSYAASIVQPLIFNVGDVMYDVLLSAIEIAAEKAGILEDIKLDPKNYYVLTLHRAENTDNQESLKEIMDFAGEVSRGNIVIFPVHPRTRQTLEAAGIKIADNIMLINPVGYFDMVWLLRNSALVLTDSGGIQKEAYWLKIPCITLRNETEWIETIQSGWNVLYREYKGIFFLESPLA